MCVMPMAEPAPESTPALGPDRRVVIADLLSRDSMPDCGTFMFETPMVFVDIVADSATLQVLVPCAELARPRYSATAGNAPVLQTQHRYRLELSGSITGDATHDVVWRADRIDLVGPHD